MRGLELRNYHMKFRGYGVGVSRLGSACSTKTLSPRRTLNGESRESRVLMAMKLNNIGPTRDAKALQDPSALNPTSGAPGKGPTAPPTGSSPGSSKRAKRL